MRTGRGKSEGWGKVIFKGIEEIQKKCARTRLVLASTLRCAALVRAASHKGRQSVKVFERGNPPQAFYYHSRYFYLRGHPCCFRKIVGQRRKPLQNDADKHSLSVDG